MKIADSSTGGSLDSVLVRPEERVSQRNDCLRFPC